MRRLMRLTAVLALAAVVVVAPACRTKRKVRATVVEEDGQLASVVNVADPRASVQLVRGFYVLENESWRWTMKNFMVTLRPPLGSGETGGRLEMKFAVPGAVFDRVGAVTLNAKVNGIELGPEKYAQAGDAAYARDVPASALRGDTVSFEFSVDKAIPPSDRDARELAIIVTTIGLTAK